MSCLYFERSRICCMIFFILVMCNSPLDVKLICLGHKVLASSFLGEIILYIRFTYEPHTLVHFRLLCFNSLWLLNNLKVGVLLLGIHSLMYNCSPSLRGILSFPPVYNTVYVS
ncbi:hypothetical protein GDO78_001052 [Eleutherodactylus coqui]|uniref:Uncharacterized protein n=1 Tax=Eleutherodactylus coqui TaxID=57060 RepID=A0A8J6KH70_ELECQ|nr:hypothetical protein GDO78_001052 [Eleutherodactylus coqui]